MSHPAKHFLFNSLDHAVTEPIDDLIHVRLEGVHSSVRQTLLDDTPPTAVVLAITNRQGISSLMDHCSVVFAFEIWLAILVNI
jgi:hypothetical protein